MAINDDDKKFIKSTIEDALAAHDKQTESKQKLNDLKYREREKKDRQEYLAELKKREEQGQATMSEKFEMLKLSIDNAILQDFKDAAKAGAKTASSGLNQMGKGVGHLTERLMMTNPITAFMWSNRDILKAVGDIGMGGLKIGGGIAKGVAGGIGGLFNQVINKKKQGNNEPEQEESKPLTTQPEAAGVAQLLQTKQDWQQQIQDIHNAMFKLRDNKAEKEAKNTNNILSQGLGGLGKSMKAVQGFVDLIAQKQKLILAGVLLGAVAIVGLAAWFKNGGLQKLIKDALKADDQGGTEEGMNFLNTQSSAVLNNQQVINNLQQYVGNKQQGFETGHMFGRDWKGHKEDFRDYLKQQGVDNSVINQYTGVQQPTTLSYHKSKNTKPTMLIFPFDTRIEKVIYNTNDKDVKYISLQISRGLIGKQMMADGTVVNYSQYAPVTMGIFTKVIEQLVPASQHIPPETPVAVVDASYEFLGDKSKFFGKEETAFNNQNTQTQQKALQNYNNFRTDSVAKAHQQQAVGNANKIQNAIDTKDGGWKAKLKEKAGDIIGGENITQQDFNNQVNGNTSQNNPTKETPNASVSEINQNSQKAQQQQKELNKKPEAKKQETNKKADAGSKQNVTIAQATPSTPMQFSDINLSNGVYNAATKNTVNLNGVNC